MIAFTPRKKGETAEGAGACEANRVEYKNCSATGKTRSVQKLYFELLERSQLSVVSSGSRIKKKKSYCFPVFSLNSRIFVPRIVDPKNDTLKSFLIFLLESI